MSKREKAIERYRAAYGSMIAVAKELSPLSAIDLGELLLAQRRYRITSIFIPELEQAAGSKDGKLKGSLARDYNVG